MPALTDLMLQAIGDVDAFLVLVWSFIAKLLVKEVQRLRSIGDLTGELADLQTSVPRSPQRSCCGCGRRCNSRHRRDGSDWANYAPRVRWPVLAWIPGR
jgi:hypothetical protein